MELWHKSYPKEVPSKIDVENFNSIPEVFKEAVEKFKDKKAFTCMGASLSYNEVNQLSSQFASYLRNDCQLEPGDRIAIQMPNILQYPVALFGAIKAGLIVVNTNPLYTEREMLHQFKDANVSAIVILANFAYNLEAILKKTQIKNIIITELGDSLSPLKKILVNSVVKYVKKMVPKYNLPNAVSFNSCLEVGKLKPAPETKLYREDTAFLQYTGGTTGVAKGAILTHGNVIANMNQIFAWMKPKLKYGEEIIVTPLPLYHIFSLSVNCLTFLSYGAENILVTNPRDIAGFIKILKKHPFTVMSGVNTLFNALVNHPDIDGVDFSNAKISVAGAMALQDNVAKAWQQKTGTKVIEGYGLTEASPVVCCNPADGTDERGSIGMPLPNTEVKLIDDDGKIVALGEAGELCARGPQVMKGYWQKQEETDLILKDGWLHTGDIAVCDEKGFFKIVDRKKDMILVSGFNVYPNEIEDVIANHPAVLEVAAVGLPSEKSGEVVKVFIVKKSPLDEKTILEFAREHLTGYKIPKVVEFRDELPKSNVGKILRRKLRDQPSQ